MVNERKEPTLSSSSIGDAKESPKPRATSKRTAARQPPLSPRTKTQPGGKSTSKGFGLFLLIVAFVALGITGFNSYQLLLANQLIDDQQNRIIDLEDQLTLTDDESTQSLTALRANFFTMSNDVRLSLSEIDKLWATRNVNRKAIAANGDKISGLEQQVDESAKSISGRIDLAATELTTFTESTKAQLSSMSSLLDERTKATSSDLASFIEKADQQSGNLSKLEQQISALEGQLLTAESSSQSLKQQVVEQELLLQSFRERMLEQSQATDSLANNSDQTANAVNRLNQLAQQVQANEEAVEAFDAFRRTVARDLLLLKERTAATQ